MFTLAAFFWNKRSNSFESPIVIIITCLLSWYIIIIIISNEYLEAGLTASISVQHIYCKHELQQELYYYYYYFVISGATCRLCNYNNNSGHTKTHPSVS